MKSSLLSLLLFTAGVWAQSAPPPPQMPDLPPDSVIATFGNGEKLTAGELKGFLSAMPPQKQEAALQDRRNFVQQFALMRRLAELAEQNKLDQQSPTRESLAFNRILVLMNAELANGLAKINVPPAETEAFYNKNQDRFAQVKVKAIYVSFSTDPAAGGKKRLTEAEAQAKIEKLRAEIVGGADFVKLVKENSEDQTSAAKDGDFGSIRRADNLPDAIRTAIFALKKGEVSQPVRQPNGFYLFRAEEIGVQPLREVVDEIGNELKQARFKDWMDETTRNLNLKYENESFFGSGSAVSGAVR